VEKLTTELVPKYIKDAGVIGAPVKHKWSDDIAADLAEKENGKLQSAIQKTHFKGMVAFATATAEWTAWRFTGQVDTTVAFQRIEMMWASVVDPAYGREVEEIDAEDRGPIEGPLSLTLDLLNVVYGKYGRKVSTIAEEIVAITSIARHVVPAKPEFDAWISFALRRLAEVYPIDLSHYNKATKKYDASYEQPVPREFFDPSVRIDAAQAAALTKKFIKSLEGKKNPYVKLPKK
jgi:hypothetical protein